MDVAFPIFTKHTLLGPINGERNNDSHLYLHSQQDIHVWLLRNKETFKLKRKEMLPLTLMSIVLAYVFIYSDKFFIYIKFNINICKKKTYFKILIVTIKP